MFSLYVEERMTHQHQARGFRSFFENLTGVGKNKQIKTLLLQAQEQQKHIADLEQQHVIDVQEKQSNDMVKRAAEESHQKKLITMQQEADQQREESKERIRIADQLHEEKTRIAVEESQERTRIADQLHEEKLEVIRRTNLQMKAEQSIFTVMRDCGHQFQCLNYKKNIWMTGAIYDSVQGRYCFSAHGVIDELMCQHFQKFGPVLQEVTKQMAVLLWNENTGSDEPAYGLATMTAWIDILRDVLKTAEAQAKKFFPPNQTASYSSKAKTTGKGVSMMNPKVVVAQKKAVVVASLSRLDTTNSSQMCIQRTLNEREVNNLFNQIEAVKIRVGAQRNYDNDPWIKQMKKKYMNRYLTLSCILSFRAFFNVS